jgi:hypothetical protein
MACPPFTVGGFPAAGGLISYGDNIPERFRWALAVAGALMAYQRDLARLLARRILCRGWLWN